MKFTFKKYMIELFAYNIFINLFVVIFFLLFFSKDTITILLIIIMLLVINLNLLENLYKIKGFIKKSSKEKIKKLENDLSNNYLIYDNWYLTDQYMFSMKKLVEIKYRDIIVVEGRVTLTGGTNSSTIGYKQIIYLRNGKSYKLKSTLLSSTSDIFKEIIIKKNSSIYFGIMEDYMRIKEGK